MSFEVPFYVVERLSKTDITPKTIRIGRDTIWITYEEHIEDKEPVTWAGVDMNSNNNTYAFPDGTIIRRDNDYTKQYNAVHSKICRVKRRSDKRIMGKYAGKACGERTKIASSIIPARKLIGLRRVVWVSGTSSLPYTNYTINKMEWRRQHVDE